MKICMIRIAHGCIRMERPIWLYAMDGFKWALNGFMCIVVGKIKLLKARKHKKPHLPLAHHMNRHVFETSRLTI